MGQHNVGAPMERIAVDVLGPLPESEQRNTCMWLEMNLKEIVSRYGVPLVLHSDQGRNCESTVFVEMCRLLTIQKTRTTSLHSQSDGMVERFNRTLEAQLAKFVSDHQRDWDHRSCTPADDGLSYFSP